MNQALIGFYINTASAANQQRDFAAAAKYSQLALALAPEIPESWYNLGVAQGGLGNEQEAMRAFEQARIRTTDSALAQNDIGLRLLELKAYKAATQCLERALAIKPDYAAAHANFANLMRAQGRLKDAEKHLLIAVDLQPDSPVLFANLGGVYLLRKSYDEAERACRKALAIDPRMVQAWINLANSLQANNQFASAAEACQKALELDPDCGEAWGALGNLKYKQDLVEEAELACRRDVSLSPRNSAAWAQLGRVLDRQKKGKEAIEAFKQAYSINSSEDYVLGDLLNVSLGLCNWAETESIKTELPSIMERNRRVVWPMTVILSTGDPSLQMKAAQDFTTEMYPARSRLGSIPAHDRRRKIRVAFLSADFKTHPVSQLIIELLETLDRARFELFGFSFSPDSQDPLRRRVESAFDHFLDVRELSDSDAAQLIRKSDVDIAVNLGGYTEGHRAGIFSMRAAPIQVSYLGYPGTMGAEYMDYLITDKTVCPPGSEVHYSEKLAYLPHCFMPYDSTQKISDRVFSRQEFSLPDSGFVFCCFNNHNKIAPEVFNVWMNLLGQVPGSVLWLSDASQAVKDNLAREAAVRGVAPARILYARRMASMAEHLARYRLADLFIDTLPYNAHTTACDALWAGVPVLTRMGQSFASRVAGSLLKTIELSELVTQSLEDYAALALELANSPGKLATIRQKLAANRMSTPLFDVQRLARDIETAYTIMYERHMNGLPPETFQV